ncbi:MAG: hypothetical protein NVSMB33_09840 [Ktedonobacteraceae bacterium]
MITCTRCGKPTSRGAANCQNCGMPLMSNASGGAGPNMAPRMGAPNQNQPELPAWLETLRSSERPGAGTNPMGNAEIMPPSNFSAAELIDEGMLPSWMRPERSESTDTSPTDAYPDRRPASTPGLNTDNAFISPRGMSAGSLIDEQALPSWMQEQQAILKQRGAQENISAASLVQSEALPEWMKTVQPPVPPANPVQYVQPPIPPQGITGNDLVDHQGLPQWMSDQDPSVSANREGGLSASSLLDANALPSWLRNANQEQQRGSAAFPSSPQSVQPIQSAQPIQTAQPMWAPYSQIQDSAMPANQPLENQTANTHSSMSAASFIDMNALPDWLKPSEGQQQGTPESPRQASFGVPVRPENVRVPSRPRSEMGLREESEVAANVFASMLGVASASPNFPVQQRSQGPGQPQTQQPMVQQQWGNTSGIPGQHMPSDALQNLQGSPSMPSGYTSPQNMQSQQLNQGYAQAYGSYPMGSAAMPAGMSSQQAKPTNAASMQQGPNTDNSHGQSKQKPAKRGFLSTILEWFSFSR